MITFDADIIGPWVARQIGFDWVRGSASVVGRLKNGRVVAGVLYENYNGANVYCHIAGVGRWLNRALLGIMFDYPFNQLGVKRITVVVADTNKESRRFVEHLGFEAEANLLNAHPDGDLIIYRMMAKDCRYIKERENG